MVVYIHTIQKSTRIKIFKSEGTKWNGVAWGGVVGRLDKHNTYQQMLNYAYNKNNME